MPQVRNSRDRYKRSLSQASNLLDTAIAYISEVGMQYVEAIPTEEEMKDKVKLGYPSDYRAKMILRNEALLVIFEGLEQAKKALDQLAKEM